MTPMMQQYFAIKEQHKDQRAESIKRKPYKPLNKAICKVFKVVRVTRLELVRH